MSNNANAWPKWTLVAADLGEVTKFRGYYNRRLC